MKKNKTKKEREKEKKKEKEEKLERPNPDFRVHQSPRGPGASPFFFINIVHLICCRANLYDKKK